MRMILKNNNVIEITFKILKGVGYDGLQRMHH